MVGHCGKEGTWKQENLIAPGRRPELEGLDCTARLS
jgi:hypothetical protein